MEGGLTTRLAQALGLDRDPPESVASDVRLLRETVWYDKLDSMCLEEKVPLLMTQVSDHLAGQPPIAFV